MTHMFLTVSTFFAVLAFTAGQNCLDYFIEYNGSCYYFGRQNLNWHQAQRYCSMFMPQEYRVKLVSIETLEEQQFLQSILQGDPNLNQAGYWTSGNKIDQRLGWTWGGAGNSPFTYGNWAPGEPSGNGNCVQMWREQSYRWDDTECENEDIRFICEYRI